MSTHPKLNEEDSFSEQLEALKKFYWEQIQRLEARIDNQEGLIAILVQSYAEVASSTEAILVLLAQKPDFAKDLEEALRIAKDKFLEVLNADPTLIRQKIDEENVS